MDLILLLSFLSSIFFFFCFSFLRHHILQESWKSALWGSIFATFAFFVLLMAFLAGLMGQTPNALRGGYRANRAIPDTLPVGQAFTPYPLQRVCPKGQNLGLPILAGRFFDKTRWVMTRVEIVILQVIGQGNRGWPTGMVQGINSCPTGKVLNSFDFFRCIFCIYRRKKQQKKNGDCLLFYLFSIFP